MLPYDLEHLFGVVGGDRGFYPASLEDDFYEFGLVLSVAVVGEPVVEVLAADTPAMGDSFAAIEGDGVDVGEEDGLGGRQREVVLVDHDEFFIHCHLAILVEYFCHNFEFDSNDYKDEHYFIGIY